MDIAVVAEVEEVGMADLEEEIDIGLTAAVEDEGEIAEIMGETMREIDIGREEIMKTRTPNVDETGRVGKISNRLSHPKVVYPIPERNLQMVLKTMRTEIKTIEGQEMKDLQTVMRLKKDAAIVIETEKNQTGVVLRIMDSR